MCFHRLQSMKTRSNMKKEFLHDILVDYIKPSISKQPNFAKQSPSSQCGALIPVRGASVFDDFSTEYLCSARMTIVN